LKGKKVHKDVRLWIATSTPIASAVRRVGWLDMIEEAGGEIMCSYCAPVSRAAPFGFKTMATNSSKATFYGVGGMGLKDTIFGTTEECINAAISGKWGE
jgi:predicted aconitase